MGSIELYYNAQNAKCIPLQFAASIRKAWCTALYWYLILVFHLHNLYRLRYAVAYVGKCILEKHCVLLCTGAWYWYFTYTVFGLAFRTIYRLSYNECSVSYTQRAGIEGGEVTIGGRRCLQFARTQAVSSILSICPNMAKYALIQSPKSPGKVDIVFTSSYSIHTNEYRHCLLFARTYTLQC